MMSLKRLKEETVKTDETVTNETLFYESPDNIVDLI